MNLRRVFLWLLALAAGTTWFLLGVYVYKFGSLTQPALSDDKGEWGTFGDFIGGTLGTYFAFLAFIGVLFTVLKQEEQIEHARAQAKLEEIQRLIAMVSARLDALLEAPPKYMPEYVRHSLKARDQTISVFSLLSSAGVLASASPPSEIPEEGRIRMLRDATESVKLDAPLVSIELQRLSECLQLYRLR